jgi:hypothetical protein
MPPHESDQQRILPDGSIVTPAGKIWAPGSFMGMFTKEDCEEYGGRHLSLTPGFENWWCDWRCPNKDFFTEAKRYDVTMRYKTDADQETKVYVYMAKNVEEPYYERDLEIPSTNGEWGSLTFSLDCDIGGFKNSSMKWEMPIVQGSIFCIKDFTFAPPGADEDGEYSGTWWAEWLEQLKGKMEGVFPSLSEEDRAALLESAKSLHEATGDTHNPFFVVMTALEKVKGDSDKSALMEARQAFEELAAPILEGMDGALDSINLDDPEVLQYLVLTQAKPSTLGSYCHSASKGQVERFVTFLKDDTQLLKQMIINGGAKGGYYPQAVDIYFQIQKKMQSGKSILPKLQLAIALELCKPLAIFDTVNPVDAVERYFNYEKAYLDGLLDPAFEGFSVWELRMVVDSDASNPELSWCRDMIFCYRPDIAYMGDYHWRYSSIVKTDVKYKHPDWTRSPRDMPQCIARGGQCGPRAFFGRFINKAMGIPTWGLVQPGHAAFGKWTPSGWTTCLGSEQGTMAGRDYGDFLFEVYMRKNMGDEFYCRKAGMLVWMQVAETDGNVNVNENRPETHWLNLAAIQRKRFGDSKKALAQDGNGQCEVLTKITQIQQRQEPAKEEITVTDDGTILVPSSAYHDTKNTTFCKSLDSGKQFNAEENWWIEYRIPEDFVPDERTPFNLTMCFASVHDNDPNPLQVVVTSAHSSETPIMEYVVPMKYTQGLLEETESVEIILGGGEEKLKLMRQKPCWPITIKDFKLTPAA